MRTLHQCLKDARADSLSKRDYLTAQKPIHSQWPKAEKETKVKKSKKEGGTQPVCARKGGLSASRQTIAILNRYPYRCYYISDASLGRSTFGSCPFCDQRRNPTEHLDRPPCSLGLLVPLVICRYLLL